MPSQKTKQKSSERKEDRDEIPIVDTDTLALTIIELFGDARVAAKLKKALYPQELVDKLDYLTKRVSALTENLRERDERIKKLEKKVETLVLDSDKVEQYSRRSNLRFSGIPEADNDVEDTTEQVLQTINDDMEVPVSRDQVERSHRLGPKVDRNGKARQRNIIIRFNRESVRDRVYKARFNLKTRNKDGHKRVFVNEDLTATRGALAYRTRTLKKEGRIMDCWTVAGKIMVKNKNGLVVNITTEAELSAYGQV